MHPYGARYGTEPVPKYKLPHKVRRSLAPSLYAVLNV